MKGLESILRKLKKCTYSITNVSQNGTMVIKKAIISLFWLLGDFLKGHPACSAKTNNGDYLGYRRVLAKKLTQISFS
jgi:hypothetical protein